MPFVTIYKTPRFRGIELEQAEGRVGEMLPRTHFKSITSAQKALNKIPKPERGYNKFDVFVYGRKTDKTLGKIRLRYEHGKDEPDLKKQLDYYRKWERLSK